MPSPRPALFGLDGCAGALTSFRMIASHVADTDATVAAIRAAN